MMLASRAVGALPSRRRNPRPGKNPVEPVDGSAAQCHAAVQLPLPQRRGQVRTMSSTAPPDNPIAGNSRAGEGMQENAFAAQARQQLDRAAAAGSRSHHTAATVYDGPENVLRQTLIGMNQDACLAERERPGQATIQVRHGRVRMAADGQSWEARTANVLIVSDADIVPRRCRTPRSYRSLSRCPDPRGPDRPPAGAGCHVVGAPRRFPSRSTPVFPPAR